MKIFLRRSLVFPILLFSSISLHCSLKAFLSLLAILWISAFSWVYLSLSLCLPFSSSKYSICIKYLYRIYIYILYVQIIYCIYIHYYRLSLQNIRVYIYRCISKCIYMYNICTSISNSTSFCINSV